MHLRLIVKWIKSLAGKYTAKQNYWVSILLCLTKHSYNDVGYKLIVFFPPRRKSLARFLKLQTNRKCYSYINCGMMISLLKHFCSYKPVFFGMTSLTFGWWRDWPSESILSAHWILGSQPEWPLVYRSWLLPKPCFLDCSFWSDVQPWGESRLFQTSSILE